MKKQLKIKRWIYSFLPLTIFIFFLSNIFLVIMAFEAMVFKNIKEATVIRGIIEGTVNFGVLRLFLIASLISMFHIMYCSFLSWFNLRTHVTEQEKLQHLSVFINRYINAKKRYEELILDNIVKEVKEAEKSDEP